ncbi:FtsK/SpoIIIE domain-containing protein [Streptomyces sp. NPDC020917]|uniref:FtsK/SpoIIIE domain-containing protein n=1 Tax=Streptomyces sp. NPDC020917 TaxID=3365102 RepID=UPI00379916F6
MQIRLTVLGPRSGRTRLSPGRCDVLITAPEGTTLGTVAGALASAAGSAQQGGRSASTSVALYAGTQRLAPTAVLGAPPLVDGALLSLHAPAEQQGDHGQYGRFGQYGSPPAELARLHVVGGPDAGGVHLLQGGQARVGRSADADVPLDDPDVSRLHCELAVGEDGQITVADLGSTNGTTLAGRPLGERPQPFPPGALLQIGESTLRLDPARSAAAPVLASEPDADGHLRVSLPWSSSARAEAAARTGDAGPAAGRKDRAGRAGVPDDTPHDVTSYGLYGQVHPAGGVAAPAQGAAGAGLPPMPAARPDEGAGAVPGQRGPRAGTYGHTPGERAGGTTGSAATGGVAGLPAPRQAPEAGDGSPSHPPLPRQTPAGQPHGETVTHVGHAEWAQALDPEASPHSGQADVPGAEGSGRRATGERSRGARAVDAGRARGGAVGAISAWARRRLTPVRGAAETEDTGEAEALRERWPDPATILLTALGPGRRLWERGPGHPDALTVRLGTADLPSEDGTRRLPSVPFTVDLRAPDTAALTLSGPRPRLSGLARAVLAQLCALHAPAALEVVLLSADRTRGADQRAEEWSWLNWLPHLRPGHGQDCRLLLAFDREQAQARTSELVRRLEAGPLGAAWAVAPQEAAAAAAAAYEGPFTLLVVDGDPGSATLRDALARLAVAGPSAGVHVLCLAEADEQPAIGNGVVARLSGDVATTLHIERAGQPLPGDDGRLPDEVVLDAVSADWAEHFARALAPLREADADAPASRHTLPQTVRLLDELDLALATPAKIGARWAEAGTSAATARLVLGTGTGGRVAVDLVAEGPHAMVGGAPGAGKTELLRSTAAALAAGERPERLALVLVDGAGGERGEGLASCADLPHVSSHLVASDPLRMREFAQGLTAELKRRAEVLGGQEFAAWHADRVVAATVPSQARRQVPGAAASADAGGPPGGSGSAGADGRASAAGSGAAGLPDGTKAPALPRLVVLVDDFDELVAPGLGSPGRPAAGSVVRALEAVARDGERLGVHLVASTGRPERTADTDADERARLRIALRMPDPESAALLVTVEDPAGLDDALPGRGYLRRPGGAVTLFQGARVSARIPRTATLRPTVVPLEWERMGDPPARRQVRELGNGPTDLALLASALQRAAESPQEEARR